MHPSYTAGNIAVLYTFTKTHTDTHAVLDFGGGFHIKLVLT